MPADIIRKFIAPRTVALVGASSKDGSPGKRVLNKLIKNHHEKVYPVNPNATSIDGLTCYPSIDALPEAVDMAIIFIPAAGVPEALRACVRKGIHAALICAAGFGEAGEKGSGLQREIKQIIMDNPIRVIGPNCVGLFNIADSKDLTISATMDYVQAVKGPVAFITQSGAFGQSLFLKGLDMGIGFSRMFSVGNKVDVDDCDLLEYLADDPATSVIMIYLEGLRDGRRFAEMAKTITPKKPIVVYKVGKREAGARAVSSHTGSLAGVYGVYQAAFRRGGVIDAKSSTSMLEIAKVLSMQPPMKGTRVGFVTNSGGLVAEMADMLQDYNMSVPELSVELQRRLREEDAVPVYGNVKNPIDLGAASPKWPDWYLKSTKMLAESGEVDAVVVILTGVITEWIAPRLAEAKKDLMAAGVPIIVMGLWKQKDMLSLRLTYHAASLPVVEEPVEVVECLRALAQRGGVSLNG